MPQGKECPIKECPRCKEVTNICELSELDKLNKWYTEPNKCTHYNWKILRKGQK